MNISLGPRNTGLTGYSILGFPLRSKTEIDHNDDQKMSASTGVVIAVVGVNDCAFGCSCLQHDACGSYIHPDILLQLKTTIIEIGKATEM